MSMKHLILHIFSSIIMYRLLNVDRVSVKEISQIDDKKHFDYIIIERTNHKLVTKQHMVENPLILIKFKRLMKNNYYVE